ncbi:nucleocytoplasmic transporter NUP145 [Ascoidea rubescens DSM 1968]|uniref:Nucleoporin2-domain-containing protein n=1 Tax=Ascoidea rubescens DSM 1968 TaxID=1344418 RepID=A0A1D2VJI8_9ASCO|nr:Nucleoporin2-domain-containing protein [Ascoidea rubescens DSM 1968]ODV61743.1 Nucleoporin2-domain-containing protein [Ascoidea rubescens DSM 1968]
MKQIHQIQNHESHRNHENHENHENPIDNSLANNKNTKNNRSQSDSTPLKNKRNFQDSSDYSQNNSIKKIDSISNREIIPPRNKKLNDLNQKNTQYSDYWCSPSIESLLKLPLHKLSSIKGFIIGRKNFGQINFDSSVDFVSFKLFHNIVKFNSKTVEVYSDESIKPAIGCGLNVPATITLENLYPASFEEKLNNNKTSKEKIEFDDSNEIRKFILTLKRQKEMEYVNYIPTSGSWTFKVNHFSIWGLISEDPSDEDEPKTDLEDNIPQKSPLPEIINHLESKSNLETKKVADLKILEKTVLPKERQAQKVQKAQKASKKHSNDWYTQATQFDVSNYTASNFDDEKNNHVTQGEKITKNINRNETYLFEGEFPVKKIKIDNDASNISFVPGGWSFSNDIVPTEKSLNEKINIIEEPEKKQNKTKTDYKILQDVEQQVEPSLKDIIKQTGLKLVHVISSDTEEPYGNLLDIDMEEDIDITKGVREKQYESLGVDDRDLELLTIEPDFAVSDNWEVQLQLSAASNSAFSEGAEEVVEKMLPKLPFSEKYSSIKLDNLLFEDFDDYLNKQNKIFNSLRINNRKNFVKWSPNGNLIMNDSIFEQKSGCKIYSFSKKFEDANKTIKGSVYEKIFKEHFAISDIATRKSNDYPVCKPKDINKTLSFELLSSCFKKDINSKFLNNESGFWELASILFEDNQKVFTSLSKWIEKEVTLEIDEKLSYEKDESAKIFLLLCKHDIKGAISLAIETKHFNLATLITLLGSGEESVFFGAKSQLEFWIKTSAINYIPISVLKVYGLLTGEPLTNEYESYFNLVENLSWKVCLGLELWYGEIKLKAHEIVYNFILNESKTVEFSKFSEDHYLNIIKLYGKLNNNYNSNDIGQIISDFKGINEFDVRIQWYIYKILNGLSKFDKVSQEKVDEIEDKLTIGFADELETMKMYSESIFILSNLNEDKICKKSIDRLVMNKIEQITHRIDIKILETLIHGLKLPQELISKAIALNYRYYGDYWKEVMTLISANSFDEAHKRIIENIAPNSIICKGNLILKLNNLIESFPINEVQIKNWSNGLQVYKDYISLLKLAEKEKEIEDNKNNNDAEIDLFKKQRASILMKLLKSIDLLEKKNFKIKAASLIMKKDVKRFIKHDILKNKYLQDIKIEEIVFSR